MANDVSSVAVGKPKVGGAVFIAPLGSTIPTDATTALAEDFECLGYISEDGVVVTEERDSETIPAWGGDTVATVQTSYTETFAFTPIEVNPVVAAAEYGDDNVNVTAGKMTVKHNSKELPEKILVIETVPNSKTVDRSSFRAPSSPRRATSPWRTPSPWAASAPSRRSPMPRATPRTST